MSTDTLFFIEPSTGLSVRARELLQSRIRSHASRHTHARSRNLRHGATTNTGAQNAKICDHHEIAQAEEQAVKNPAVTAGDSNVEVAAEHSNLPFLKRLGTVGIDANDRESRAIGRKGSTQAASGRRGSTTPCRNCEYQTTGGVMVGGAVPKPLCPSTIRLNGEESQILDYFTTMWLPSTTYIPPGCHIVGYAPALPRDALLSSELVTEAAQASSELHMYALLAITVCRMRFVHRVSFRDDCARERYYGIAVRALREYIASNQSISPRIIFDVSLLTLSEGFVPQPTRPQVYSQLLCFSVRACGGLANIDPFIAQFGVATDLLTALLTFTFPALDLHEDPALLGLSLKKAKGISEVIASTLADLSPRLRVLCEASTTFIQVMRAIHHEKAISLRRLPNMSRLRAD